MPKITTFLAYDHQAEDAVRFYLSIFPNSRIRRIARYAEGGPMPAGMVLCIDFTLDGQDYAALNGGPHFKFTDAISLSVDCKTQGEIDRYWEALSADGGEKGQCGWLRDKFGVRWQVNSTRVADLMADFDPEKARRAMQAMLGMTRIVIEEMERAVEGVPR